MADEFCADPLCRHHKRLHSWCAQELPAEHRRAYCLAPGCPCHNYVPVRGEGRESVKEYPDMKRLFAAKEARRRTLASLPVEEKMEIAERLREMAQHAPGRLKTPGRRTVPKTSAR